MIPIHLLRLGDAAVVGVPFETTVEAGRRIGRAVLDSALEVGTAFVSSLVDDHTDYLTTPEEYAAQYYEGASVLFGPRQQEWVAGQARRLAEDVAAGVRSAPRARSFDFGVHRYLAEPTGTAASRLFGPVRFVEADVSEDAFWEQRWTDVAPGDLVWHQPLVRVEAESDGNWAVVADDQGWHLGVTYLGRKGGRHTYVTRWYGPPLGRPGRHRFVLLANGGQPELAGPAFD